MARFVHGRSIFFVFFFLTYRGRCGRDRTVVGLITTYAISG